MPKTLSRILVILLVPALLGSSLKMHHLQPVLCKIGPDPRCVHFEQDALLPALSAARFIPALWPKNPLWRVIKHDGYFFEIESLRSEPGLQKPNKEFDPSRLVALLRRFPKELSRVGAQLLNAQTRRFRAPANMTFLNALFSYLWGIPYTEFFVQVPNLISVEDSYEMFIRTGRWPFALLSDVYFHDLLHLFGISLIPWVVMDAGRQAGLVMGILKDELGETVLNKSFLSLLLSRFMVTVDNGTYFWLDEIGAGNWLAAEKIFAQLVNAISTWHEALHELAAEVPQDSARRKDLDLTLMRMHGALVAMFAVHPDAQSWSAAWIQDIRRRFEQSQDSHLDVGRAA